MSALLGACATPPAAQREALNAAGSELPYPPLALTVSGGDPYGTHWTGSGSGVLVHPRIVLTANHVVPPEPRAVSFGEGEEASRILRVVRGPVGSGSHAQWRGDWVLIILAEPPRGLRAVSTHLVSAASDPLPPGSPLIMAGFAFARAAGNSGGAMARTGELVRTEVVSDPGFETRDPDVFYASGRVADPELAGCSGGPVFVADAAETWTLAGIYLGRTGRSVLGIQTEQALVVRRIPAEQIWAAAAELERAE